MKKFNNLFKHIIIYNFDDEKMEDIFFCKLVVDQVSVM